jgi:hypothetical protein
MASDNTNMQIENSVMCMPNLNENTISDCIRQEVWNNYFGHDQDRGKCFICKNYISRRADTQDTYMFMCAYYISCQKGGLTHQNNLIPVCRYCHIKLNGRSLEELVPTFQSMYQHQQQQYQQPKSTYFEIKPSYTDQEHSLTNISMDIDSS